VAKQAKPTDEPQAESVAGYFRKVFRENPKLLKERSNDELYRRWLADHPGHEEVPAKVKTGLQNIKSVLRAKRGKKKAAKQGPATAQPQAPAALSPQAPRRLPVKGLQQLEEQIDEVLGLARGLDREGLQDVIAILRRARNAVVRRGGGE
jgi:hypothetical protein